MADDTSPDNNDSTPASPTTAVPPMTHTPGQYSTMQQPSLADTIFGTDRIGLNSAVRSGQVQNGLRSAQTEVAIQNAAKAQREAGAVDQIGPAFDKLTGNHDLAGVVGVMAKLGQIKGLTDLFGGADKFTEYLARSQIQGQPGLINTPQGTADVNALVPAEASKTQTDQGQLLVRPGMTAPTVVQTPASLATEAEHRAQATKANQVNAPVDQNNTKFLGYQLFHGMPLPAMGNGQAATAARQAAFAEAQRLSQLPPDHPDLTNPGYDQAMSNHQDFIGSQRAVNNAAGGLMSRQTTALNNSVGHLQLLEQLNTALHNGDIGPINAIANKVKTVLGLSTAPTTVQAASSILGPELNKVMVGSGAGAEDERANFTQLVSGLDKNPENSTAAIQTLKSMLGRQASDLQINYKGATKRGDFGSRYFAPDVKQYLGIQDDQPGATGPTGLPNVPAATQTQTPAPTTPAAPAGGMDFISKDTYAGLVAKVGQQQADAILKQRGAMVK